MVDDHAGAELVTAKKRCRSSAIGLVRQIGFGIELRHVRLTLEQLHFAERSLQSRERLGIEAAILRIHPDDEIVFARHHGFVEMSDAAFDLDRLGFVRTHIVDSLDPGRDEGAHRVRILRRQRV